MGYGMVGSRQTFIDLFCFVGEMLFCRDLENYVNDVGTEGAFDGVMMRP